MRRNLNEPPTEAEAAALLAMILRPAWLALDACTGASQNLHSHVMPEGCRGLKPPAPLPAVERPND